MKSNNQRWKAETEVEPEDKMLSTRVRILENRINRLEVELEELKYKLDQDKNNDKQPNEAISNTELKEQLITIKDSKENKLIQLKDVITSFGSKYIVKLPFKEILGIRIPIKIILKNNITYKILALVDTGCTKNIIHDKYFIKCPEIVHTIDEYKTETSTDMSRIKKIHNQLAYNIEAQINGTKYIIDEITIRDLSMIHDEMIIGLRFLQRSCQTTIIHEQNITFIPHEDNIYYISKVKKHGGAHHLENSYSNTIDASIAGLEIEDLSGNIEDFYIEHSCIECFGLQSFAPNWYRDIKSKKNI